MATPKDVIQKSQSRLSKLQFVTQQVGIVTTLEITGLWVRLRPLKSVLDYAVMIGNK